MHRIIGPAKVEAGLWHDEPKIRKKILDVVSLASAAQESLLTDAHICVPKKEPESGPATGSCEGRADVDNGECMV